MLKSQENFELAFYVPMITDSGTLARYSDDVNAEKLFSFSRVLPAAFVTVNETTDKDEVYSARKAVSEKARKIAKMFEAAKMPKMAKNWFCLMDDFIDHCNKKLEELS